MNSDSDCSQWHCHPRLLVLVGMSNHPRLFVLDRMSNDRLSYHLCSAHLVLCNGHGHDYLDLHDEKLQALDSTADADCDHSDSEPADVDSTVDGLDASLAFAAKAVTAAKTWMCHLSASLHLHHCWLSALHLPITTLLEGGTFDRVSP